MHQKLLLVEKNGLSRAVFDLHLAVHVGFFLSRLPGGATNLW